MTPDRISIVIPTRDRADMIGAAIDSLLAQTLAPDEIIVVDDGSRDATGAVLARYGDRLRVLPAIGSGPSAARNTGLAEASGTLIGFLDSDDALLPEALAILSAAIGARKDAFAWGRTRTEILPGGALPHKDWPTEPGHAVQLGSMLFRRDMLCAIGGFDAALRFGEDLDLLARGRAAGWREVRVIEIVSIHRRHPDNITREAGASRAWFDVARQALARRRDR